MFGHKNVANKICIALAICVLSGFSLGIIFTNLGVYTKMYLDKAILTVLYMYVIALVGTYI